ncbi:MAG: DUF1080 domain-containing protein [Verrucomicrobiota bacterium]|jgi:hypothetical protein|nr:DUF1080 domain-containing protein [Verrucomicrobiota bacterium]HCF93761.1 hypothetical protein [Verrucomicrobiota bacterium]
MKIKMYTGLLGLALIGWMQAATAAETIQLFDGKSFEGWDYFLVEEGVKLEDVWAVNDGIIVCKGEPFGYLYTQQAFKNYKLVVEWRWAPGKKPSNSGVLLRIAGDHRFLPRCAEAQLQFGSAGDIWAFEGMKVTGHPARTRDVKGHELLGDFVGVGKIQNNEKDPGEWNRYEITFDQDVLALVVNGVQVNVASGLDNVAGAIGLQSEGGEIHFRKVELTPLD